MNIVEGSKRIILVVSLCGFALGCAAGWVHCDAIHSERVIGLEYQRLVDAPQVKTASSAVKQYYLRTGTDDIPVYTGTIWLSELTALAPDFLLDEDAGFKLELERLEAEAIARSKIKGGPSAKLADPDDLGAVLSRIPTKDMVWPSSMVVFFQRGNVAEASINPEGEVQAVKRRNGEVVGKRHTPAKWTYLVMVLYPALGFYIPWLTGRLLIWIGLGFFATPTTGAPR